MDRESVERFLVAYASDLASGDGNRIIERYDSPALFLSDGGGYAATRGEEFAAWFTTASTNYRERGFGDPRATLERLEDLTERLAIAFVTWHYRDVGGNLMFDADYAYALRHDADRVVISTVFSINEAERAASHFASQSTKVGS